MDIQGLKNALGHLNIEDNPAVLKKKSRDFYWFSPILKRELDQVIGDLIVSPKNEAELIEVISTAFRMEVPITPRGAGTGNYGQAMPLSGGLVLNLLGLNDIDEPQIGSVVAGAGATFAEIDSVARFQSAQELRIFPSTYRTASIGGFVAGGSGGIGSIRWGGLRDLGNITRARIVTVEARPRILTLEGDEVLKIAHAYGTNGVITQVEMPLAPAYTWVEMIVAFDQFDQAFGFADDLGNQDGILLKELAAMAAPIAQSFFAHHGKYVCHDQATVFLMCAAQNLAALKSFIVRHKGEISFQSDTLSPGPLHGLPPLFECTWNHTTLFAHHANPNLTYLQILYPYPHHLKTILRLKNLLGSEIIDHLEFVRFDGRIGCMGIPLILFTTEERMEELIKIYEDHGCIVFNPHRYTLEEGGMKRSDPEQLAFKRENDPRGLLNPGKMIAWDKPEFNFSANQKYLFSGIRR
jgi:FAD/FMN-containing dehydrogenase